MSYGCDGRLVHSPGPAAENALSPKVLYVRVTTHVRSLWNAAAAHEHRRQDSSRRPGTIAQMPDNDWWTILKWTRWRTDSQCSWRSTGDTWSERRIPSPDGQRRSEPTAAGSSVLSRCRRTASCSSPGGRKRTPGLMLLASSDSDRIACRSWRSW